jgi:hypothetical protein
MANETESGTCRLGFAAGGFVARTSMDAPLHGIVNPDSQDSLDDFGPLPFPAA